VDRHSKFCSFYNCALCREVSHRELFAKTPSLPLVLEIRTVARKFSIGGLCVSAGGIWVCAGGLDTLKTDKNSTDL